MIKRIIAGILISAGLISATTLTPIPHTPVNTGDGAIFNGSVWVQK